MAPTNPRVSFGLPVYNGERYLEEAIESILAQTFEDFELVISDNASTDGTEEICRRYADKDDRIRYSRNTTNIGGMNNGNRTFRLARAASTSASPPMTTAVRPRWWSGASRRSTSIRR